MQQNSEEFVKETTTAGFSADSWNDALSTLTKLKGIGPATAALLLSTSDPETLPFFSDELFRWAFWENNTGAGWDRKIKYSVKEYRELKEKVDGLRNRTGKGAIEAEKVAYVLGKREADLSASQKSGQGSGASDEVPLKQEASEAKVKKADSKRKVAQAAAPDDGLKPESTKKKQKKAATSTSQRVTRSSGKSDSKAS